MSDEMAPRDASAGATLTCAAAITPERLSAWRDGLLPAAESARLATHAAGCQACSARLRDYDRIGAALRGQIIPQPAADPWPAMRLRLARDRRGLRPLPTPRGRVWGGLGALVAAALLVALFAGLLAHQASRRPTAGATATVAQVTPTTQLAAWTTVAGYQGLYGLAVAPSDPRVAYQFWFATDGTYGSDRMVMRRTDDQGATWHALTPPFIVNATQGELSTGFGGFVSPFDTHVAYVMFNTQMNSGAPYCGPNGIVRDGLCQFQYITTDSGLHWQPLSLPAVGSFNSLHGQRDASAQPTSSRLYGMITPPALTTNRLVRSDDGGLSWQLIDAPILAAGQRVAQYSATPTGSTIFALAEPAGTQPGTFPALTIWRSDDAGATWTNLGQAPSVSGRSMQAAMVVNSGKPLLYLVTTATSNSGPETIQGSLFGDSGSFLTAPDTTPECTVENGAELLGARDDGSVIAWCGGALQSWIATPARAADSGWRTLTQDPATSSVQSSFMQTLPDGSTRLWLVTDDNKVAKVEYVTLPK